MRYTSRTHIIGHYCRSHVVWNVFNQVNWQLLHIGSRVIRVIAAAGRRGSIQYRPLVSGSDWPGAGQCGPRCDLITTKRITDAPGRAGEIGRPGVTCVCAGWQTCSAKPTAVAAYLKSKQLLQFSFARQIYVGSIPADNTRGLSGVPGSAVIWQSPASVPCPCPLPPPPRSWS